MSLALDRQINMDTFTPGSGSGNFEPFAGTYLSEIIDSEVKPIKSGLGERTELAIKVLEGPHKGRSVWVNLNLRNQNETTMDRAYETLAEIAKAAGITGQLTHVDQVHNKPMMMEFYINGSFTNVRSYAPAGSSSVAPATTAAADYAAASGGAPKAPSRPWERS